jgi:hypothetical protein
VTSAGAGRTISIRFDDSKIQLAAAALSLPGSIIVNISITFYCAIQYPLEIICNIKLARAILFSTILSIDFFKKLIKFIVLQREFAELR